MNEIEFYPELCLKLEKYLKSYSPVGTTIKYAYNSNLTNLVAVIEREFNLKSSLSLSYLPNLKLDILFGIKLPNKTDIDYILFEVKYLKQLGLAEYSQLVGYLQVAKQIRIGILLLVLKYPSASQLSNDFSEIINMKDIPMEWQLVFDNSKNDYKFNAGICYYVPNNGIEWINTIDVNGISSFENLTSLLNEL